jgi:hypothetical protein
LKEEEVLVKLINGELMVKFHYEISDSEYDDNICLCVEEPCQEDEHIFSAEQPNLYNTPFEARLLAQKLISAADQSEIASRDSI